MRGTLVSPTEIFWHEPAAIDVGRYLFGVLWNPDDCTEDEAAAIQTVLRRAEECESGCTRG